MPCPSIGAVWTTGAAGWEPTGPVSANRIASCRLGRRYQAAADEIITRDRADLIAALRVVAALMLGPRRDAAVDAAAEDCVEARSGDCRADGIADRGYWDPGLDRQAPEGLRERTMHIRKDIGIIMALAAMPLIPLIALVLLVLVAAIFSSMSLPRFH